MLKIWKFTNTDKANKIKIKKNYKSELQNGFTNESKI